MAAALESYKPGSIYILKRCPPLHGGAIKDRPVVIVRVLQQKGQVIVVAVSTSDEDPPADRVELPEKTVDPQTGLDKPSAAIPQWYFVVSPRRLGRKRIGQAPSDVFLKIEAGVRARVEAWFPPVRIDDEPAKEQS